MLGLAVLSGLGLPTLNVMYLKVDYGLCQRWRGGCRATSRGEGRREGRREKGEFHGRSIILSLRA